MDLQKTKLAEISETWTTAELTVEPEKFRLSSYEWDVMPGVIGSLVNIPIQNVGTRWKLGRVASFEVTPYSKADPILVVSPQMDLRAYYAIWASIVSKRMMSHEAAEYVKSYDLAVARAIKSARLTDEEVNFAISEFMGFRNQLMKKVSDIRDYLR